MPTIARLPPPRLHARGASAPSASTSASTSSTASSTSALLENFLRDDLNTARRACMAVLRPLKVVIDNYPEGQVEELDASTIPRTRAAGTRKVPFSRELYIERDDFARRPRRRSTSACRPATRCACATRTSSRCTEVVKNAAGNVVELHCTYDPDTRGGNAADGRKVKGTIHWVSAAHAVDAEVRLYDRLFTVENPLKDKDVDFKTHLNPGSLEVAHGCQLEPSLARREAGTTVQFERLGYFCVDTDSKPGAWCSIGRCRSRIRGQAGRRILRVQGASK